MPSKYVSAARMRKAGREIFEGGQPEFQHLSDLSGRRPEYWAKVAQQECWRRPEASAAEAKTLERRLIALSDRLVIDLEAASAEGHAAGSYDKSRIDALSAMLRMVEKLGEMTRVPERAAERQERSDAELATAFSLIDARIVELACELAACMGVGKPEGAIGIPAAG